MGRPLAAWRLGAGFAIRGGARVIKPVFGLALVLLLLRITVLR